MEWPQKPATTLQSSFYYRSQLIPSAFPADPEKKNKNLRLRKSTRGRWEIGKKKSILEATSLQHMPNPDMANFPFSSDQKLMPKNYNLNTRSVLQEEDLYTSTQTIAKNYRCCQMLNIIYNYMYCIYTYIYILYYVCTIFYNCKSAIYRLHARVRNESLHTLPPKNQPSRPGPSLL